ncbi:hypothetical protein AERO9AM_50471 [Aeromicrobium sp. 9AM]|nr:hypothetical protein AERO9AM_50471 [Aeromicrobium sp. 9AM]
MRTHPRAGFSLLDGMNRQTYVLAETGRQRGVLSRHGQE